MALVLMFVTWSCVATEELGVAEDVAGEAISQPELSSQSELSSQPELSSQEVSPDLDPDSASSANYPQGCGSQGKVRCYETAYCDIVYPGCGYRCVFSTFSDFGICGR